MKAIKQAQTRNILDAYNKEDISYSRMNEMFNELADEFAIGFARYIAEHPKIFNNGSSMEQVLSLYKIEK